MYGKKVKLRILFISLLLISVILSIFLILKSLEENVVYFFSPTEIKSLTEIKNKKITDYSQSWTRSNWSSIPRCSKEEYDIDRYKWETYPNPNAVKGSRSFWRGRWFMYCCTHDESTDLKHPFWEFDGPYVVFPD